MEEKKRTLLAVVISFIILAAVVYSFGLNFFASTPEIVVADPSVSAGQPDGPGVSGEQGGIPVEVTPETVQSVIASMSRYRRYSRTVSIRYSWPGGSSEPITAKVRVDDGWSRCDTTLAGGIVERSIVGDGTLWYWYGDGGSWLECPADERAEDLLQYIPTYEDVLALDQSEITATGYEEKDGTVCIYVEAARRELGYLERYWISVSSGLLVAAETEKEGSVVYAMSSGDMVSPMANGSDAFTLPDGTVLHTVQS